jgi:hypothetical protein
MVLLLAAFTASAMGAWGDPGIPEELLAEFASGDLVVVPLADLVNGEDAGLGFGFLGDDPLVGLRFGRRRRRARTGWTG